MKHLDISEDDMLPQTPEALEYWPTMDLELAIARPGSVASDRARMVQCSTKLIRTGLCYSCTLAALPEGHRMSALDEIAYLLSDEGKDHGRAGRRLKLGDKLFQELLYAEDPLWEWTSICVRAPRGAPDFRTYTERRNAKTYYRVDYVVGDVVSQEGVWLPEGYGGKVVEWNRELCLPAEVSRDTELEHVAHFYFDPTDSELAVMLCRGSYVDERHPCLDIVALYRRSMSSAYCAFRPFADPGGTGLAAGL